MIRSKTLLAIIIVLIVVVVIAVPTMYIVSVDEKIIPPVAVARADRDRAYLDENITFSGKESKGDIRAYLWNFSDGNSSTLQNPVHSFGHFGWYNVTLQISDRKGQNDSCNMSIGIQCNNESDELDGDRIHDFRRGSWRGQGFDIDIGPNNGNPNISYDATLIQPIGHFIIEIEASYQLEESHYRGVTLYSDDFISTGKDFVFSYDGSPEELPPECSTNQSYFRAVIWAETGTWKSSYMSIAANYSLLAMLPPPD